MEYFKGLLIGFVAMSILWVVLILGQINNPVATSRWVYDAYTKKSKLLADINGSRLVIVAGSNALFGIDSKLLEKKYKIPTINFGVNAGLFLPYILYKAKSVLRSGDIVLLPLEYSMYLYNGEPNEQMIGYTYSFDPDFFWSLSLKEQFNMIWKTSFSRVLEGYIKTGTKPISEGLYGAHHIDNHGDQTHSSKKYMGGFEKDIIKNIKPTLYGKDEPKRALAWKYLKEFNNWAKSHNICTIYIPPVFMDQRVYHTDKKEIAFYKTLPKRAKEIGLNFIGNPYDFMYKRDMFFNTDYHLNAEAREVHTQNLIELLGDDIKKYCKYLKK